MRKMTCALLLSALLTVGCDEDSSDAVRAVNPDSLGNPAADVEEPVAQGETLEDDMETDEPSAKEELETESDSEDES